MDDFESPPDIADPSERTSWKITARNEEPISGHDQIWEFESSKFTWRRGEAIHATGTYTFNPKRGYLDLTVKKTVRRAMVGFGDDGAIQVCVAKPGGKRPSSLDREQGDIFQLEPVK
jgi:hypothetical protein